MQGRLAELAIASLDDPDAAVVLGDWVLENKWFDMRVMPLLDARFERLWEGRRKKAHVRMAANGARAWARAVAAVLLFGEWPDAHSREWRGERHIAFWPAVMRCWRWGSWTITSIDTNAGSITFDQPPLSPTVEPGWQMQSTTKRENMAALNRRLRQR